MSAKEGNNVSLNEDDSTSEVGLDQAPGQTSGTSIGNMWKEMFEAQQHAFQEMMKMVVIPVQNQSMSKLDLPTYNPEEPHSDPRAWCTAVDLCVDEGSLSGSALIRAVSKALKGSASAWLPQVVFAGITWPQFKAIFLSHFAYIEPPTVMLLDLMTSQPKPNESLSEFGNRVLNNLTTCWQGMTVDQIAVSTALAHVARVDSRARRLAYTLKDLSRENLLLELKALPHEKRLLPSSDKDFAIFKRPRLNIRVSQPCTYCSKANHRSENCFFRNGNPSTSATPRPSAVASQAPPRSSPQNTTNSGNPRRELICFTCQAPGHISFNCPQKKSDTGAAPAQMERRVDVCRLNPTGQLNHDGKCFSFTFDSGAECSLMKASIAKSFNGELFSNLVVLSGIGRDSVNCPNQILSQVVINDCSLDILFHILPDEFLSSPIMIGREILQDGYQVVISPTTCTILPTQKTDGAISVMTVQEVEPISFDDIKTEVPDEFRPQLVSILESFRDFFTNGIPRTRVTTGEMEIRLIDPSKVVQRRPYRLSPSDREVVRKQVKDLESAGIIRPSRSPFSSPIILVKKKDGSDRMCVDYRELNANTIPERFPLPLISDQIARLGGARFFCSLDMASGFHQVPVHPNSIEKTAFVTPDGQWEYTTTPFGLRNAPSVFQRSVMNALGPLAHEYAVVFMDDLLIVARTVEESLERLRKVLEVLTWAGFSLKLSKCSFVVQRVLYLGFVIQDGQMRANPLKVHALTALPPPKNVTELRGFIGLASYFRKFIPMFSQVMAPLYKLTSLKGSIPWSEELERVRQQIISVLTSDPVLTIFNPEHPIELHTDASSLGYGAILFHVVNNRLHVVEYFSKRTTPAEAKYTSYMLETLGVVFAVKNFSQYLTGRKFTLVTDCNSLKSTKKKKDLLPCVQRWWAFLQAFDFDVVHRDGSRMAHVDFFSRNPVGDEGFVCPSIVSVPIVPQKVEQKRIDLTTVADDWLRLEQDKDGEISGIVSALGSDCLDENLRKTYEIRSGILYRKIQRNGRTRCLPYIPRAYRWSVINNVHESLLHLGWEKTLEKIYEICWFDGMSWHVRKFVDNCITCKVTKSNSGKVQASLHPIPKESEPWRTIHMDATGKLSGKSDHKEYIFVTIDAFTKYVLLHLTSHIDTENSISALKAGISLFGSPCRIIADQGRCFASKEFKDFCDKHSIELHLIATGASRANGQVERVMSTLKNMLTAAEIGDKSWQDSLGDIQLAMNCTQNRVTKASPLELMFGKVARPLKLVPIASDGTQPTERIDIEQLREQAGQNIIESAEYDKKRFNKTKAKVSKLSVGDYALIKNEERNQTKLDPKFRGPFKVVELLEGDRYLLKSLTSKRVYKYPHDRIRKVPRLEIPGDVTTTDTESDSDNN